MEHARHAERFLVDFLPAVDMFSEELMDQTSGVRTVIINDVPCADLQDDGLYTLKRGGPPLVMRGGAWNFERVWETLNKRIDALEERYHVEARATYYPSRTKQKIVPAVEIKFDSTCILATIGPEYLRIYFDEQPALPEVKPLDHWYPGMVGAYRVGSDTQHPNCLRFSPKTLHGEFEHAGTVAFEFDVERKERYVLSKPLKLDRDIFLPVPTHGRHLESEPMYHLATFLHMLEK